jgi:alkyl sulfatase BDS1-like metallo-beta-lactamase superfamily hydrolase
LVRSVALPPELRDLPYLQPLYGRVDWAVRGIYRSYVPWYDGHGSNLDPLPSQTWARELLALAGGADKVLTRAIAAQQNSEHQLAIQLCDLVLQANPQDKVAHLIKASSLDYLSVAVHNINTFGFYRSAAALERKAVDSRQ